MRLRFWSPDIQKEKWMAAGVCVTLLLCTAYIDVITWMVTPNYANFRHFVDPSTSHAEDKAAYLLSPLAFQIFFLLAIFRSTSPLTLSLKQYLLLLVVASLLGTTVSTANARHAVLATQAAGLKTTTSIPICMPMWSIVCLTH